jgi:hypothetical protein
MMRKLLTNPSADRDWVTTLPDTVDITVLPSHNAPLTMARGPVWLPAWKFSPASHMAFEESLDEEFTNITTRLPPLGMGKAPLDASNSLGAAVVSRDVRSDAESPGIFPCNSIGNWSIAAHCGGAWPDGLVWLLIIVLHPPNVVSANARNLTPISLLRWREAVHEVRFISLVTSMSGCDLRQRASGSIMSVTPLFHPGVQTDVGT